MFSSTFKLNFSFVALKNQKFKNSNIFKNPLKLEEQCCAFIRQECGTLQEPDQNFFFWNQNFNNCDSCFKSLTKWKKCPFYVVHILNEYKILNNKIINWNLIEICWFVSDLLSFTKLYVMVISSKIIFHFLLKLSWLEIINYHNCFFWKFSS